MSRFLIATRAIAVTAVATATLFSVAGIASANSGRQQPASGDDRATAHEGNVVAKDCASLFPGSTAADLTHEIDGSNTYIDITGGADGVQVVGVIVKGGPAYNQYDAAGLGEMPWLDLHSPLVPSGKPAQISHWFACGTPETPETTTTLPTHTASPTSSTEPGGEVPGTETPGAPDDAAPGDAAPGEEAPEAEEALAETGANVGWPVAIGAALLLGGGAMLFLMRRRRA